MLSSDFQTHLKQSMYHLHAAERVLHTTFPRISDPRLLLVVLDEIYSAFFSMMKALHAQRVSTPTQRTSSVHFETYESLFPYLSQLFEHSKLDLSYLSHFTALHCLKDELRTSAICFSRKDAYVLCSEDMQTTLLSKDLLESYLQKANTFITEVSSL